MLSEDFFVRESFLRFPEYGYYLFRRELFLGRLSSIFPDRLTISLDQFKGERSSLFKFVTTNCGHRVGEPPLAGDAWAKRRVAHGIGIINNIMRSFLNIS